MPSETFETVPGTYTQVAEAGVGLTTCGLTLAGKIRCGAECPTETAGCNKWQWEKGPWTTGAYTAIASSDTGGTVDEGELCAIRAGGGLVCWGDSSLELPAASGPAVGLSSPPRT